MPFTACWSSRWHCRFTWLTYAPISLCRCRALIALLTAMAGTAAEAPRLSSEQLAKAVRSDAISVPTPGELFAALGKPGKPNWSGQFRPPIPTTYKNRPQIALNLGGLIADGFVAVGAEEGQQGQKIGADTFKFAKAPSANVKVLGPSNRLTD